MHPFLFLTVDTELLNFPDAQGLWGKVGTDEYGLRFILDLFKLVDIKGTFFPQHNHAYFLEINTRLGGATEKVLPMGFNEPALCLEAYGFKGKKERLHFSTNRKRIVNKRRLLKHIKEAAIGKLTELDYPTVNRFKHICYSCFELFFVSDSVFDLRDISGGIWFHFRLH